MAVASDAAVGDARCVKELGVDALVALAGALVAGEAAFGRAPVEAVVVLQMVKSPVVQPQRHVVFRAVCLLPALGHGVVCVSSRGFEQKEHRKLNSLSIGSAHAF